MSNRVVTLDGTTFRDTHDQTACPVCGGVAYDRPTDVPPARLLRRLAWACAAAEIALTITFDPDGRVISIAVEGR